MMKATCLALQRDLNTVVEWCTENKMHLNVDKCSVISFTAKKNRLTHSYHILDKPLCRKETVKDLGVLFDEKLTFRPHYEQIIKRGNRLLGFIMRWGLLKILKNLKAPYSFSSALSEVSWSIAVQFGHHITISMWIAWRESKEDAYGIYPANTTSVAPLNATMTDCPSST